MSRHSRKWHVNYLKRKRKHSSSCDPWPPYHEPWNTLWVNFLSLIPSTKTRKIYNFFILYNISKIDLQKQVIWTKTCKKQHIMTSIRILRILMHNILLNAILLLISVKLWQSEHFFSSGTSTDKLCSPHFFLNSCLAYVLLTGLLLVDWAQL